MLSAAVTAAHLGLSVVLEKEALVGGTTAWSGGWMWIPHNPLARAAGIDEDLDEVRRYLSHLLSAHCDAPRLEMFLAHGPAMVDFHQRQTALRFIDGNAVPDFHGRAPGARCAPRPSMHRCSAPSCRGYGRREIGPRQLPPPEMKQPAPSPARGRGLG